jgi:tetratricopeptide (TPR) repeat protein
MAMRIPNQRFLRVHHAGIVTLTLLATSCANGQAAVSPCGELANPYGPFDYRTDRDKLQTITKSHFTPSVEALIKGVSGPLGAELDYSLRAFPNHHRALLAMTRLFERSQWLRPEGATLDIDCYFDRALRFRPKDVVSRMLYCEYLEKRKRRAEALLQLGQANVDAADDGFAHYNIGLHYLELGQFDKAVEQAQLAQELGFTERELINRLRATGHWKDGATVPRGRNADPPAASAAR